MNIRPMMLLALKYFGIFILAIAILGFILDAHFRTPGWKGPVSDHFDGKQFFNIRAGAATTTAAAYPEDRGRLAVIKWLLFREGNQWANREVTQTKPRARVMGREIVATFINHATVLIQTEGLNIITDPIYAERASPVGRIGPKRYSQPGVAFDDLPPIDIVLLSHNHYDHMDVGTLKALQDKFHPVIIAPLGNKEFLKGYGIDSQEMDWWSTYARQDGISVTLVPSQHFSARAISDRNKSLWGGYVISAPEGDIYFAGDTGYGPFVDRIRKEYPDGFRFGILPIGAFKPEWIMGDVHIGPPEMLRMAKELSIKKVMPIHFGTFKLAGDKQDEPADTLKAIQVGLASAADSSSPAPMPVVAGFNGSVVDIP